MENGNTSDSGNAFALGVALGEFRARFTASDTARAACEAATNDRLQRVEARAAEAEMQLRDVRTGLQLLTSNAGMRLVRVVDDTTGEETLALEDAATDDDPDDTDGRAAAGKGGKSVAKQTPSSNSGQAASGKTVQPDKNGGKTGAFDRYRTLRHLI